MKKYVVTEKRFPILMSQDELKGLGQGEVGYLKPYKVKGEIAWVLHGADGVAIAVQNNAQAARESAQHQDIALVSLH